MCGIAGIFGPSVNIEAALNAQVKSLIHRGPNSSGIWRENNIGLAHTRLAIQDLSSNGHQPMMSRSKRYVIVFNGEIYNFKDLRKEIPHISLKSNSDTEVLLEYFSLFGIEECLKKIRGQFAFSIWDRERKKIFLARDHIGQKPLYYGVIKGCFIFGSELKALRAIPEMQFTENLHSVHSLIKFGYIPSPYSIYHNIMKLEAGSYIEVSHPEHLPVPKKYWNLVDIIQENCNKSKLSYAEACNELDSVLSKAVSEQMISDVPIGSLLSGGIDSSLIAAKMQQQSIKPINTYTIGFNSEGFDESRFAKQVSEILGTNHTELFLEPSDALNLIPQIPVIYDEPFADSSQLPTFLVSRLTKEHVTVCLSGDAGDELFGGYNRYFWANSIWKKIRYLPNFGKRSLSKFVKHLSTKDLSSLNKILPTHSKIHNLKDKFLKAATVINSKSMDEVYLKLLYQTQNNEKYLNDQYIQDTLITDVNNWPPLDNFTERMMAIDTLTYLPDDILVKVDRASMAVSLESRIPFLDTRVIEMAWRLPLQYKVSNTHGKLILKHVLQKYLPSELIHRPKQGFSIPVSDWLKGPLKSWAEDIIHNVDSKHEVINKEELLVAWKEFQDGRNIYSSIWAILMYESWKEKWL